MLHLLLKWPEMQSNNAGTASMGKDIRTDITLPVVLVDDGRHGSYQEAGLHVCRVGQQHTRCTDRLTLQ